MDCERFGALVHELCDGAVSSEVRAEADAHAAACGRCRRKLQRARRLEDVLGRGAPVPRLTDAALDAQRQAILRRAAAEASAGAASPARSSGGAGWAGWRGWPSVAQGAAALLGAAALVLALKGTSSSGRRRRRRRSGGAAAGAGAELDPAEERASPRDAAGPRPAPARPALPGEPEHLLLVSRQAVAVALADTPSDRVQLLLAAASARLRELRAALQVDDAAMAEELAEAYAVLLEEGVAAVLTDRELDELDLIVARSFAQTQAGLDEEALTVLARGAPARLRGPLQAALAACRRVAHL
ncbi:MAG: hypothetical protein M9894_23615 [Planctomycetes bacterium]|nr:hypothetical protein [Planctomycetota bacterium]